MKIPPECANYEIRLCVHKLLYGIMARIQFIYNFFNKQDFIYDRKKHPKFEMFLKNRPLISQYEIGEHLRKRHC